MSWGRGFSFKIKTFYMGQGYLDEMGEYCEEYTEPFLRKRRPRNFTDSKHCKKGVFDWLRSWQPRSGLWSGENAIVLEYAKFNEWELKDEKEICVEIQKDFKHFVNWFKTRKGTSFYDPSATIQPRPIKNI